MIFRRNNSITFLYLKTHNVSSHWCKKVPSDILVKFDFSVILITGWCPLHCRKRSWFYHENWGFYCLMYFGANTEIHFYICAKRYHPHMKYSINATRVNGTFLHELFILNEGFVTPVNLFTWYLYVCIAYTVSNTHFLFTSNYNCFW